MKKTLNFDDGVREYAINGDESRTVRVMISDLNLGKRIADLESKVSAVSGKYRALTEPTAEQLAELDQDVRSIISEAFGTDICTQAFGAVNCCSPVSNGKLLFEGFLSALTVQVKADIAELKPATVNSAVAEYLGDLNQSAAQIDIAALTDDQRRKLIAELTSYDR